MVFSSFASGSLRVLMKKKVVMVPNKRCYPVYAAWLHCYQRVNDDANSRASEKPTRLLPFLQDPHILPSAPVCFSLQSAEEMFSPHNPSSYYFQRNHGGLELFWTSSGCVIEGCMLAREQHRANCYSCPCCRRDSGELVWTLSSIGGRADADLRLVD